MKPEPPSVQPPGGSPRIENEAELATRARGGDRVAFGRLVEPLGPGLTGGGPRPDREAEQSALGDRLRAALAELPERRRIAVVLFDVEGYSHSEIAQILGIPEGTVRSEVFHARRRLRELLADWR